MFGRIVRCVKALQLSYQKSIATPANWPNNHADIGMKGSVFLLPTVSPEEAESNYSGYYTCPVPSEKPYLRLVKAEVVGGEVGGDGVESAPPAEDTAALKKKIADLEAKLAAVEVKPAAGCCSVS